MKNLKVLFIVAIFGLGLTTSCTPEGIEDGQTEQQVKRDQIRTPQNG